jgi:hypothetical protein
MDYLDHPERATAEEISSLNMLTHESTHVRGEYNARATECQAVQRDYRAARLLGVPESVARKNALDYYHDIYLQKGRIGGILVGFDIAGFRLVRVELRNDGGQVFHASFPVSAQGRSIARAAPRFPG